MRIYIHTGMHKTGTTSLQQTLASHGQVLESAGYRALGNMPRLNARKPDRFDPGWITEQVRSADNAGIKALIISAEVISTFNTAQLNSLLKPFHAHEVVMVTCLRHWISFLPSRWVQNSIRRDAQSFPAYLERLREHQEEHIDARFNRIIERMIAVRPNDIRLISYENATASDSLLATTLAAFDLPQPVIARLSSTQARSNPNPGTDQIDILRLFNGLCSRLNNLEPNELFVALTRSEPVSRFYDQAKKTQDFLNNNRALKTELSELAARKNTRVLLSQLDSDFVRWQSLTEAAAEGYVVNPVGGQLFPELPDNELVCSGIGIDDIPEEIQRKMAKAFAPD